MKEHDWKVNDILQIDPASDETFGACFMIVTEVKPWGAQGYFMSPGVDGLAFYRVNTKNAVRVGRAEWVAEREMELV